MGSPIHINGHIGKHEITYNKNSIIKIIIQNESGKYILFEDKDGKLDHFYLYLKHDMSITNTICNYLRVYINYFKIRPNEFELLKYFRENNQNIYIYKLNHILPSKSSADFYLPKQSNFIKIKIVSLKELKELGLYYSDNENEILEEKKEKNITEKKNTRKRSSSNNENN